MLKIICLLAPFFIISLASHAQTDNTAQVAFLGLFHFDNPGLDKIKTKQTGVSDKNSQAYLLTLTNRIAKEFAPTHVLLECPLKAQMQLAEDYQTYLEGNFALPINENYQIGFRVAQAAGLPAPICYDERDVQWQAAPLFKALPEKNPETQASLDRYIQDITQVSENMHATLSLRDLLIMHNQPELDIKNKALYLLTNHVGAGDTFEGADAAASWWHRNFRMYANVQKVAVKNTRTLVVGGQGHTAILKDLLTLDSERQAVDIKKFL